MELHAKKRIEIVVERPLLERVLDVVRKAGATGYTVLPAMAGMGHSGEWDRGDIASAFANVVVIVVADPDKTARIVDPLGELLADYRTILLVSDVSVVRAEHF